MKKNFCWKKFNFQWFLKDRALVEYDCVSEFVYFHLSITIFIVQQWLRRETVSVLHSMPCIAHTYKVRVNMCHATEYNVVVVIWETYIQCSSRFAVCSRRAVCAVQTPTITPQILLCFIYSLLLLFWFFFLLFSNHLEIVYVWITSYAQLDICRLRLAGTNKLVAIDLLISLNCEATATRDSLQRSVWSVLRIIFAFRYNNVLSI